MVISSEIICPRITRPMFMKAFFHINPPTLFEVINCFSMIDGHVHHIMKVLEDSTSFIFSVQRKCLLSERANNKGRWEPCPYPIQP